MRANITIAACIALCSATNKAENGPEETVLARPSYISDGNFEYDSAGCAEFFEIPRDRPVRIYCDGVYDLFHYGHMRQLHQAKKLFEKVYLIVGVHADDIVQMYKRLPILTMEERCESVGYFKYVDKVVKDAPWFITEDFLMKHKIDFVAHDEEPYPAGDGVDDLYGWLKKSARFIPTRRTSRISTTELIKRVVDRSKKGIKEGTS
ncbi:choline-phosphate cytidylyltransferase [Pancytospora philotis]|nr:choline-phosphate cytidylyltransferase [Pancytospora philotis]